MERPEVSTNSRPWTNECYDPYRLAKIRAKIFFISLLAKRRSSARIIKLKFLLDLLEVYFDVRPEPIIETAPTSFEVGAV